MREPLTVQAGAAGEIPAAIQVHAAPLSSLISIHKYGWVLIRKGKYFTGADM